MLTRDSTELTDPRVVPSLADRWSHHTGGTHFKVVPSHWRATTLAKKGRRICSAKTAALRRAASPPSLRPPNPPSRPVPSDLRLTR